MNIIYRSQTDLPHTRSSSSVGSNIPSTGPSHTLWNPCENDENCWNIQFYQWKLYCLCDQHYSYRGNRFDQQIIDIELNVLLAIIVGKWYSITLWDQVNNFWFSCQPTAVVSKKKKKKCAIVAESIKFTLPCADLECATECLLNVAIKLKKLNICPLLHQYTNSHRHTCCKLRASIGSTIAKSDKVGLCPKSFL